METEPYLQTGEDGIDLLTPEKNHNYRQRRKIKGNSWGRGKTIASKRTISQAKAIGKREPDQKSY